MSRSFPPKLSGIFPLRMKSWMNCVSFAAWLNLQTIPVTGAICKIRNCSKPSELRTDTEVQKQVAALTESDFTRSAQKERQATQKELLNLPLLPTTTIGSSRRQRKSSRTEQNSEKAKSAKKNTEIMQRDSSGIASLYRKTLVWMSWCMANLNATTWWNFLAKICLVMCLP